MLTKNYTQIQASSRLLGRIQSRGTRGNIIKSLAELIKNSDDTYYRLEQQGKKTKGIIQVIYWKSKKKSNYISAFVVKDSGEGMDEATVKKAYAVYGEDTSQGARSGAIGVGGKDALYGMEETCVVTSKGSKSTVVSLLTPDKNSPLYCDIQTDRDANKTITELEKIWNTKHSTTIDVTYNGTTVCFKIPANQQPRLDFVKEKLQTYYTLRTILQDKGRRIEFLDAETGNALVLRHENPRGTTVHEDDFEIEHNGRKYDIELEIKKSSKLTDKDKETGYNILICDEAGAVLDNTLFGFEKESAAAPFFGEVIIHDWRSLYKSDGTVLTDNREGLDYNNPFNAKLKDRLLAALKPLIKEEEEKRSSKSELSGNMNKRIKRAFKKINQIVARETKEKGDKPTELDDTKINPDVLQFYPQNLSLILHETKKIGLYVNPEKVPPKSTVQLSLKGKGIKISSTKITTADSYPPNVLNRTPFQLDSFKPISRYGSEGTEHAG